MKDKDNVEYVQSFINLMLENDKPFASIYDLLEVNLLEEKNYNMIAYARASFKRAESIIKKYQKCIDKLNAKFPNEHRKLEKLYFLVNDLKAIVDEIDSNYVD